MSSDNYFLIIKNQGKYFGYHRDASADNYYGVDVKKLMDYRPDLLCDSEEEILNSTHYTEYGFEIIDYDTYDYCCQVEEESKMFFPCEVQSYDFSNVQIFGQGVYENYLLVCYYPSYVKLAKLEGKNTFPCKLAIVNRNAINNFVAMESYNMPETIEIGLIIYEEPENYLSQITRMFQDFPPFASDEHKPEHNWFITNIEEVVQLCHMVREIRDALEEYENGTATFVEKKLTPEEQELSNKIVLLEKQGHSFTEIRDAIKWNAETGYEVRL